MLTLIVVRAEVQPGSPRRRARSRPIAISACASCGLSIAMNPARLFRARRSARAKPSRSAMLIAPFDGAHKFLDGRLHEYGTTLLVLAGLFNLLAISNAL